MRTKLQKKYKLYFVNIYDFFFGNFEILEYHCFISSKLSKDAKTEISAAESSKTQGLWYCLVFSSFIVFYWFVCLNYLSCSVLALLHCRWMVMTLLCSVRPAVCHQDCMFALSSNWIFYMHKLENWGFNTSFKCLCLFFCSFIVQTIPDSPNNTS